ncbi:MAG: hypothetical protein M1490_01090 [Candidatus Bathyarchaeota archaeon]|nr:hypothetical protein [Candidatus Bathyarchaeota archaeon]
MTSESSCIDVTGKTPTECQKIFAENMELPSTQFIKRIEGKNIYYIFRPKDWETVPLNKI